MKNAAEIAAEAREEADRLLRQAAALSALADVLDPPIGDQMMVDYEQATDEAEQYEAPFGYKADGTPRLRPGPSEATKKKMQAARRARRKPKPKAKAKPVKLRVLSSTHPTEKELQDREVVHTTEEPA